MKAEHFAISKKVECTNASQRQESHYLNMVLSPPLAIEPFVFSRKNWLFAKAIKGAKASAVIYSIVETAREDQLLHGQNVLITFQKNQINHTQMPT